VNDGSESVTVYPPNPSGTLNEAPSATIAGSNAGLSQTLDGVAVDASGKSYVASFASGGAITVYPANPSGTLNEAPLATIQGTNTELALPVGIAFDASGKIYVTNVNDSITVYPANPSGTLNEAPLATITGSNTALSPVGIALDASGKIYVANEFNPNSDSGTPSVTVYAANPSGTINETPLATIAGSNTGLTQPVGVAVDASGKIYVVNCGTCQSTGIDSINVYAANPSGTLNEAPLATITGSNTGLTSPVWIALH
jgi:hypothetical protein